VRRFLHVEVRGKMKGFDVRNFFRPGVERLRSSGRYGFSLTHELAAFLIQFATACSQVGFLRKILHSAAVVTIEGSLV
jgi:hypothetical protein